MRNSLPLAAAVFAALIVAGALASDALIQLTLPGDPCYQAFLWVTVALFGMVFLASMGYLGVLTMRVVEGRWVGGFPDNMIAHAVGCATLTFTAMSPFIVLQGPKSSVSYGERVAVIEALEQAQSAQKAVERFWLSHRHFPGDIVEAGIRARPDSASTAVELFTVTHDGALTLTLASPRYTNLDAKTLVMRPTRNGERFDWDCRGGDLPDHVRPMQCRRESACRVLARWSALL